MRRESWRKRNKKNRVIASQFKCSRFIYVELRYAVSMITYLSCKEGEAETNTECEEFTKKKAEEARMREENRQ